MTTVAPGSRWLDKTPPPAPGWRRIVEVAAVDDGNGFVEGIGWWQERLNGDWCDTDYPGARRKTRIRASQFVHRYQPIKTICAHCGRPMGDYAGGYASVPVDGQSQPVCHPNDPDRPDCYRLVTVYHEPIGSRKEQR